MNERDQQQTRVFHADETVLEIEGKHHFLIAALSFANPSAMTSEIVQLKQRLGLQVDQEIKWNQQSLPAELRYKISDSLLQIVSGLGTTVLLSLREGTDKQAAAEMMLNQVFDYCKDARASSFSIYCDRNLCPDLTRLWNYAHHNFDDGPICAALQEVESVRDQLMQCVDVFAGLFRTAIRHELEGIRKKRTFFDDALGSEVEVPVSWFIIMSSRWNIPGEGTLTSEELERGDLPYKNTWGRGFRVESSVSENVKAKLKELAIVYMGCLH